MIFGVTNIYEVSSFSIDMTEPLGIMELNFTIGSIYQSNTAISDCSNALHGLFIDNDETIVRWVRDNDQVLGHVLLTFNA